AIVATIFAAVATIVGAAVANASWWYTYLAPAGMLVAAGLTGLAIVFCGLAAGALDTLCACTSKRCTGQCSNMRNLLIAARVVLGIQLTACLAVALYAWIPGAAQPAMSVIIGSLVIQAALIISAFPFFASLASCAKPT